MKSGIHPEYHEITVIMTDGTEYTTRSCYGKAGDTIRLDIDTKSHPAWTGVQRIMDTGGQVAKFNKRFAGIGTRSKADFSVLSCVCGPALLKKEAGLSTFGAWLTPHWVGQTELPRQAAFMGPAQRQNLAERGGST